MLQPLTAAFTAHTWMPLGNSIRRDQSTPERNSKHAAEWDGHAVPQHTEMRQRCAVHIASTRGSSKSGGRRVVGVDVLTCEGLTSSRSAIAC